MNTTQADQMEIDIETVSRAILPNHMLVIGNKARRDAERNVSQAWVRIICLLRLTTTSPAPTLQRADRIEEVRFLLRCAKPTDDDNFSVRIAYLSEAVSLMADLISEAP